jgi:hypothetical protein
MNGLVGEDMREPGRGDSDRLELMVTMLSDKSNIESIGIERMTSLRRRVDMNCIVRACSWL